jgi:tetratricopeptide (TPR) repeat protein
MAESQACEELGYLYQLYGRFLPALAQFKLAHRLLKDVSPSWKEKSARQEARLLFAMGRMANLLGNMLEAEEHLHRALDTVSKLFQVILYVLCCISHNVEPRMK